MSNSDRSTLVWKVEHDFQADELEKFEHLYHDWIYPNTYESFRGKEVLDAGSGPGIQVRFIAKYAKHVTAVDLEALQTTTDRTQDIADKVTYIADDIGIMDLGKQFDVVNCVGVIHHTDNPDVTFNNLYKHTKSGGKVIIWAYADRGNFLMRKIVEPFRRNFLSKWGHDGLWRLSCTLQFVMNFFVFTLYRLPLNFLPYYEYFANARKMSFKRNALNVYDKLNAPQTHFITERQIKSWFGPEKFKDVRFSEYLGVSWRCSGTKL
jgi:SAM-dependent methyltransferase